MNFRRLNNSKKLLQKKRTFTIKVDVRFLYESDFNMPVYRSLQQN
jgi:hypothetical protein